MGFSGYDVSICSHNIWRWYAIKEQIILTNRFNPNEKVNFLGFSRSNNWFVNAAYLPGVLSKSLIKYLGDDFLLAKPLRLLEIGSYEGGSSVWFIRYMLSHSQSLLTCIDPWSPEVCEGMNHSLAYDTFMANIALTNKASQVRVIRNDSMLALANLLVDGETFDFIYIDGSHLLADVIADLALSWQLLAVGGVLAIDDVPAQAEGSGYVDNYTFKPSNLGTKASPPYCSVLHTPDSRGRFLLEDSIVAFLAHLRLRRPLLWLSDRCEKAALELCIVVFRCSGHYRCCLNKCHKLYTNSTINNLLKYNIYQIYISKKYQYTTVVTLIINITMRYKELILQGSRW